MRRSHCPQMAELLHKVIIAPIGLSLKCLIMVTIGKFSRSITLAAEMMQN